MIYYPASHRALGVYTFDKYHYPTSKQWDEIDDLIEGKSVTLEKLQEIIPDAKITYHLFEEKDPEKEWVWQLDYEDTVNYTYHDATVYEIPLSKLYDKKDDPKKQCLIHTYGVFFKRISKSLCIFD